MSLPHDLSQCYTVVQCKRSGKVLLPWTGITTYIITMRGSPRNTEKIEHLTDRSFLVINEGYKKCWKDGIDTPFRDLFHANNFIFDLESDIRAVRQDDECKISFDPNAYHSTDHLITEIHNLIKDCDTSRV